MALTLLFAVLFTTGFIGRKPHERAGAVSEEVALTGGAVTPLRGRTDLLQTGLSPSSVTLYRGHDAAYWARKYRARTHQFQAARKRVKVLHRTLMDRPSVSEALNLAGAVYGNSSTLWALARCESGFSPTAKNASSDASGLLQFMPGTFASTPYGRFSIWSPYASAMAGGWMLAHGRRGEWVC